MQHIVAQVTQHGTGKNRVCPSRAAPKPYPREGMQSEEPGAQADTQGGRHDQARFDERLRMVHTVEEKGNPLSVRSLGLVMKYEPVQPILDQGPEEKPSQDTGGDFPDTAGSQVFYG